MTGMMDADASTNHQIRPVCRLRMTGLVSMVLGIHASLIDQKLCQGGFVDEPVVLY